jgi:hypothetical protein
MGQRVLVASLVLAGCTTDATEPPPVPPAALPTCAALELAMPDGRCARPGIPVDGCAEGFVHDGAYGCDAVLPAETCADGSMAVPGETACRPVMGCGQGKWGAIPIDATTQHVDGSYTGTDSDGSEAKPWISIDDAITAAASGAIIAVAEGTYLEDVDITGKPVRIWGVCPERVEIVGQGMQPGTVFIHTVASGVEVRGISVRAPGFGLVVSGAEGVIFDRVWVREAVSRGFDIERTLGPASATIQSSLIERSHELAVYIGGGQVTVASSVVRGGSPGASQTTGHGVHVQISCTNAGCDPNARGTLEMIGSLVEDTVEVGVYVTGSDATLDATVVRRTLPRPDATMGRGIYVGPSCSDAAGCDPNSRANVTVRRSVIEQNHETGMLVLGSDVIVDTTVVRDTQPNVADGWDGRGMTVQPVCTETGCNPQTSIATITSSLIERNHEFGIDNAGSDITVESTVVRDTQPRSTGQFYGRGINVALACTLAGCDESSRPWASIVGSLWSRTTKWAS